MTGKNFITTNRVKLLLFVAVCAVQVLNGTGALSWFEPDLFSCFVLNVIVFGLPEMLLLAKDVKQTTHNSGMRKNGTVQHRLAVICFFITFYILMVTPFFFLKKGCSSHELKEIRLKKETDMFHYQTGEEVHLRDKIFYPEPFGEGYVSYIFSPNSKEAVSWKLPEGGIMLGFGEHDVSVFVSKPEEDEDLEFISRETVK